MKNSISIEKKTKENHNATIGDNRLPELSEGINEAYDNIEKSFKESVQHAIKAGKLLIEAKDIVPHGQWSFWVEENCIFSDRTAQAYMKLAQYAETNPQHVADLSLRKALKSIAKPKTSNNNEAHMRAEDTALAQQSLPASKTCGKEANTPDTACKSGLEPFLMDSDSESAAEEKASTHSSQHTKQANEPSVIEDPEEVLTSEDEPTKTDKPKPCLNSADYYPYANEVMGFINLKPSSYAETNEESGTKDPLEDKTAVLNNDWEGNIWLNLLPFQDETDDFVNKLISEAQNDICREWMVLCGNETQASCFQSLAQNARAICFQKSSAKIGENLCQSGRGLIIFYAGKSALKFKKHFSEFGLIIEPK